MISNADKQAGVLAIAAASVACEQITMFPAEVSAAQAILESYYLQLMPAGSNNCFGIKATDSHAVYTFTKEWVKDGRSAGHFITLNLAFESYPTLAACFAAHAALIIHGSYYTTAWQAYLKDHDIDSLVEGIAKHYATDPNYALKVIALYSQQNVKQALAAARIAPTPTSPPA
jgi:flagellum-specific peptidoglycan hydrolase FlgJ